MKTLIYCENDFEARLIVGRLENNGIRAVVQSNHIHNILPYLNNHSDAFSVQVHEEDYHYALRIISIDAPATEDANASEITAI